MSRAFTVLDVAQRSPAWAAARLGRLTGSRAADMLATVKGGESIGRRTLREQLARERRTGRCYAPTFNSPAMQAGLAQEGAARTWYEALTGRFLTETGFLVHDTLQAGVSLDGHVGDYEGLVEIKCPLALTHAEYLSGGVPGGHRKQIVHALWLTGARWCDWVSFNPEFPPDLRAIVVRVARDEQAIASYALAVALFLREVDVEALRGVA
jgi:hypothetical protein